MQDIAPQHEGDRVGWLLFLGAAGLLVILLVGIGLGVFDAKTSLVDQLTDALR